MHGVITGDETPTSMWVIVLYDIPCCHDRCSLYWKRYGPPFSNMADTGSNTLLRMHPSMWWVLGPVTWSHDLTSMRTSWPAHCALKDAGHTPVWRQQIQPTNTPPDGTSPPSMFLIYTSCYDFSPLMHDPLIYAMESNCKFEFTHMEYTM